jgi:hypothetical protein
MSRTDQKTHQKTHAVLPPGDETVWTRPTDENRGVGS